MSLWIILCYHRLTDPQCTFITTHLLCFETWHFHCLSLHPPLLLCPSVSLFVRLTPRILKAKTVTEAFKGWVISPPENTPKCSFSPPRLDIFSLFLSLPMCSAFLSLCPSLHLVRLCISAVFHGLSLSLYISISLPCSLYSLSSRALCLFCTSGTPGWLLRADT